VSYQTLSYEKKATYRSSVLLPPKDEEGYVAQLSAELTDLCSEIRSNRETRVIILAVGAAKSFAMEMESMTAVSPRAGEATRQFWSLAEPIAQLDRPVIAAINGDAIGQGLKLALASVIDDRQIMSHFEGS